jgi:DNA (cytosine-5)-methyltransferase 1
MNEQPTHLDLFSGIGGFALAARWAGFRTIGFCEIEPYCQAVLKKHWPEVPVCSDIRELRGGGQRIDLLTGGFPCQPFSYCGKRRGKNDHRNLWPEMLRIIKEQRPAWVIGENVAGIINMELDQVHSDLESEGYSVQTLLIPACAVGAIHRRNRAWIIANNNNIGMERGGEAKIFGVKKIQRNKNGGGFKELCGMPPISTPRIFRACDGVPGWVDRLKGLGNAIVPQVAYQIIKGIKEVMEQSDEN